MNLTKLKEVVNLNEFFLEFKKGEQVIFKQILETIWTLQSTLNVVNIGQC